MGGDVGKVPAELHPAHREALKPTRHLRPILLVLAREVVKLPGKAADQVGMER